MTDKFELPVKYKGQNLRFSSQLIMVDGRHCVCVHLDETEVYFEPNEQRNYRAVAMPGQNEHLLRRVDQELLQEIAIMLKAVLK